MWVYRIWTKKFFLNYKEAQAFSKAKFFTELSVINNQLSKLSWIGSHKTA